MRWRSSSWPMAWAAIPPKLAAVIHKALSREPEERYPDATAFRTALKRFV